MLTASEISPARPRPSRLLPWRLQPSVYQTLVPGATRSRMPCSGVIGSEFYKKPTAATNLRKVDFGLSFNF